MQHAGLQQAPKQRDPQAPAQRGPSLPPAYTLSLGTPATAAGRRRTLRGSGGTDGRLSSLRAEVARLLALARHTVQLLELA